MGKPRGTIDKPLKNDVYPISLCNMDGKIAEDANNTPINTIWIIVPKKNQLPKQNYNYRKVK